MHDAQVPTGTVGPTRLPRGVTWAFAPRAAVGSRASGGARAAGTVLHACIAQWCVCVCVCVCVCDVCVCDVCPLSPRNADQPTNDVALDLG
jgi:hypothetical protein